jgi:2-(1,2-epoxy-1,2-dihydrophenyl)acetyl-CoA isomerase
MGDNVSNGLREITAYLHNAIATFAAMDAPLITAINGTAAGAGFSLAILGDIAITAESAKFTLAYTGAGLSPDGSSTYYLPRLVGVRRARELMITNRVLSAREAEQWGLVNQVVADDEVLATAMAQATKLAKGPTLAYGQVKKLLDASMQNSLESQMQLETEGIAGMAATSDGKEGIAAFLEKRKPDFKGS